MKNIKMPQTNCYCGQTGDNTLNMLQCAKCKRWFHEECVKCLDLPMLYGDRFFIFICSVCNAGTECLGRMELTWLDIVHLVLYNLSVLHKKKYFSLNSVIVPFVFDNWQRFYLFGSVASEKTEDKQGKVLKVLESCKERFKSGKEVKKSKFLWGLRERTPPSVPTVIPSASRIENDSIIWDFKVKDRAYQILTVKKSILKRGNCKNGKAKIKFSVPVSAKHKISDVSKCRGSLPHHENEVPKAKHRTKRTTNISFNEESARLGLLDSLIPAPPDFNQYNNPFEKSSKVSKRLNSQSHKIHMKSNKRRRNGENTYSQTIQNGNHQLFDDKQMSHLEELPARSAASEVTTKDYLNPMQTAKTDDFCIIGKRITTTGKVQYLFQRNRTKMEKLAAEQDPPFKITFSCNCNYLNGKL